MAAAGASDHEADAWLAVRQMPVSQRYRCVEFCSWCGSDGSTAIKTALVDTPELAELQNRTLVYLERVALLGGYAPDAALAIGERYDTRFLTDRVGIFSPGLSEPLHETAYRDIEDVDIGGPGLVRAGGGFVGGGFGAVGALEGMAIAAVLNALTTRTSIKTILRVQARQSELFLLYSKSIPEQLRIELSQPLGVIRATKPNQQVAASHSSTAELSKLAEMLQSGLIAREEFDHFKADLMRGRGGAGMEAANPLAPALAPRSYGCSGVQRDRAKSSGRADTGSHASYPAEAACATPAVEA
jgi:hypothetical protein